MTFEFTKREALAICFHLQAKSFVDMDSVRKRRELWVAMGIKDLADDVREVASNPKVTISLDWVSADALKCELSDASAKWLADRLGEGPFSPMHGELIVDVHDRIRAAK